MGGRGTHRLVEEVDAEELALAALVRPVTDLRLARHAGLDRPPSRTKPLISFLASCESERRLTCSDTDSDSR